MRGNQRGTQIGLGDRPQTVGATLVVAPSAGKCAVQQNYGYDLASALQPKLSNNQHAIARIIVRNPPSANVIHAVAD